MYKVAVLLVLSMGWTAAEAAAQTSYRVHEDERGAWIQNFYPLYEALAQGDVQAVRRLMPEGEAINGHGEAGATPLSWFLTTYHDTPADRTILRELLEHGADPNRADALLADGTAQGTTVARYAARHASAEATRLLLDHGLTFETPEAREAFVQAAAYGNVGFLATAREAGALTDADVAELPLLAAAALKGEMATVLYLLDLGAPVDALRIDGFTPLHWAVIQEHLAIVSILVEAGADPSLRSEYPDNPDFDGRTSLELARVVGADAVISALSPVGDEYE